jgi:hypothetical protein
MKDLAGTDFSHLLVPRSQAKGSGPGSPDGSLYSSEAKDAGAVHDRGIPMRDTTEVAQSRFRTGR